MTISMYQASVPVFIRALQNLAHILHKGEAHALEKGVAPDVVLQGRLILDMLPLVRQVQIATDMVKNGGGRLAGVQPPVFADDEASFEQLHARIERAITFLQELQPAQIDGGEERTIVLNMPTGGEMTFQGQGYLTDFVLPNLFFHTTMVYAILRQAGAPLGKRDFFGAAMSR